MTDDQVYFYFLVTYYNKLDQKVIGFFVGRDDNWSVSWIPEISESDDLSKGATHVFNRVSTIQKEEQCNRLEALIVASEMISGLYRISKVRHLKAISLEAALQRIRGSMV